MFQKFILKWNFPNHNLQYKWFRRKLDVFFSFFFNSYCNDSLSHAGDELILFRLPLDWWPLNGPFVENLYSFSFVDNCMCLFCFNSIGTKPLAY